MPGRKKLMSETKMSEIIRASLAGIKEFTDLDTVVGGVINTPSGVTVIPISRVTMGIATGGVDYGAKNLRPTQNFGGGGGTGVSITPIAFLTVDSRANVNLIHLKESSGDVERITSLIEHTPDIAKRLRDVLS